MGSSDSDSDSRSRRRKKSRRSRSKSRSRESRHHKSSKKHKSRSHSRSKRSSSRSPDYRKRSDDSRSKGHRKHGKSSRHSRSGSETKSRKPHKSRSRSYSAYSRSSSTRSSTRKSTTAKSDPPSNSVVSYMSAAQQAEMKLQMALKAAAAADEQLKLQGILPNSSGARRDTLEEQQKRANAIEDIDSGEFFQTSFKSTRGEIPLPKGTMVDASHAGAMFGTTSLPGGKHASSTLLNSATSDSIMHACLFVSSEDKMARWIQKLTAMRKKTLKSTGGVIP